MTEIRRRREKTIQTQSQIQKELLERVKMADDETEREKFLREAQKAEKKVKTTRRILEQGDAPEEIREVTPMAPNLEGGTMSTFQSARLVSPEPTASSMIPQQERALASRRHSLTIAVRTFAKASVSMRISTTRTGSNLSGILAEIITTKAGLISILALSTSVR